MAASFFIAANVVLVPLPKDVAFFAFDCLFLDGKSLLQQPLSQRLEILCRGSFGRNRSKQQQVQAVNMPWRYDVPRRVILLSVPPLGTKRQTPQMPRAD